MKKSLISLGIAASISVYGVTAQASISQTAESNMKPFSGFPVQDAARAPLVVAGGGRGRGDGDDDNGGGGRGQGGQGGDGDGDRGNDGDRGD